ncbi:GDSL esterase/lipase [Quillaja saponaria]|uniref:GDSL esterase/lipase n=1 Tax=Quillaja saponaria TaxID=32244 RepID=A0AAD7P556_QUISA|nr:GDSL esterase/lipase [Quillaja saponaria]
MRRKPVMARLSSLFLIFFLGLVSKSFGLSVSKHSSKLHAPFFIFGDSIFDAGNNNYISTTTLDQANFWPYGETYFKFPTGRFSDGRLISDFIAEYAKLPPIPPFLKPGYANFYHGVNFASGGAGALVETYQGSVIPLNTQIRNFKKVVTWYRHKLVYYEAKMTLSRAVYMFSIGANDYISPFVTNSGVLKSYSAPDYVGMVLGNLTITLKEIYKIGGRKFAFINLPPLGCLPAIRVIGNGSCFEEVSSLVKLHNQALPKLLLKLDKQLKGFKYSLYDFHSSLSQRINHPSKYGFKEGKTACCGTGPYRGVYSCGGKRIVKEFELCDKPNAYVFWDSYHPTENANKQIAAQMWNRTKRSRSHIFGPYNLKELFQE